MNSIKWKPVYLDGKLSDYDISNVRGYIKNLIDEGLSDIDIAIRIGLQDPKNYGKKYVHTIRRRYVQDKGSTTIPQERIAQ